PLHSPSINCTTHLSVGRALTAIDKTSSLKVGDVVIGASPVLLIALEPLLLRILGSGGVHPRVAIGLRAYGFLVEAPTARIVVKHPAQVLNLLLHSLHLAFQFVDMPLDIVGIPRRRVTPSKF